MCPELHAADVTWDKFKDAFYQFKAEVVIDFLLCSGGFIAILNYIVLYKYTYFKISYNFKVG